MISDTLKEILAYTHSLGFLNLVKVSGSPTETTLNAMAADKSVVLNSTFVQPESTLDGVFGLHDLGRLNTILNLPVYKENAFIKVNSQTVNGATTPAEISFQNSDMDFRNVYRLMGRDVVEAQLPPRTLKAINWDISFTPTQNSIQRLKMQSQAAGGTVKTFNARVENGSLVFALGEPSSHQGEFIFASNVNGKLKVARDWPLENIQGILNLNGDKVISISDAGAMEIQVITGLAIHKYMVFASIK